MREICSSGEPLNPEVIERVRRAWGLTLRDCYGQTETTMMVGNPPGQKLVVGSMGRPLPGYRVVLLDVEDSSPTTARSRCRFRPQHLGLTPGYLDDDGALQAIEGEHYRTGDIASRDGEGFLTYVGRADDLFKSSDYRLSPFELESALLEHPLVAEAAVAPAPDPIRLTVPKAYVDARRCPTTATAPPRCRCSRSCATGSRPTSASAASSSSPSCRRPCRARSAASRCASAKPNSPKSARAPSASSASRIFRIA